MDDSIVTTVAEDPKPLQAPRHPYLHLAEGLEDLRGLLDMIRQTTDELVPVLRSATPPSVQQGKQVATAHETTHFLSPVQLDRCAVQLSMVEKSCSVLGGHIVTLAGEMLEQGIGVHLPDEDDGDDD